MNPSDPRHPITSEPKAVRAPHGEPDLLLSDTRGLSRHAAARLVVLDRACALTEPLAGVDRTDYEHDQLELLAARLPVAPLAVLVTLLWRARQADPLPEHRVTGGRYEDALPGELPDPEA